MDNEIDTKTQPTDFSIETNQAHSTEYFTISSSKAAEILGVNRTRLSQLTSKGLFPYERRKVESRSRLFYRLNDLLNYQRKSSFGNLPVHNTHQENKALIPLLPPPSAELRLQEPERTQSKQILFNPHRKINVQKKRILKTALSLQKEKDESLKIHLLSEKVNKLETQIQTLLNIVQKTQHLLLKNQNRNLRIKKSMLHRPRTKPSFKLIK